MKKLCAMILALLMAASLSSAFAELVPTEQVTEYTRPDHWMASLEGLGEIHYDLPYAGEASNDKQKLHIVLPEEEGPHPLLIYIHGAVGLSAIAKTTRFSIPAKLP